MSAQVLWASADSHHWQSQKGRAAPLQHPWHRWTALGHRALPAWHSSRSLQKTVVLIEEEAILVTLFVRHTLVYADPRLLVHFSLHWQN